MPFKSKAQIRWGHTKTGKKALGGAHALEEWMSETPKGLPEKVKPPKKKRS